MGFIFTCADCGRGVAGADRNAVYSAAHDHEDETGHTMHRRTEWESNPQDL